MSSLKILLSGASSFSGFHILQSLSQAGHEVWATLQSPTSSYRDLKKRRIQSLPSNIRIVENTPFGSTGFLNLLEEEFDIYGHHGAWTQNYRSIDYELHRAFENNTHNIKAVMECLSRTQTHVVISSSIFEGNAQTPPFSPHGLVKSITTQAFFLYAQLYDVPISRLVIPNPFGPLDNAKIIAYLCKEWFAGRVPIVQTPQYIRDNIPVDLLALSYRYWIEQPRSFQSSFHPSGYQSSMGEFAKRVAKELAPRLQIDCPIQFAVQTRFEQPKTLINNISAHMLCPQWSEERFWDLFALDLLSRKENSDLI
ncbi:MAG: NAD(P)-dependent oxidoreductase [Myxococcota bacterium]|nr:NAD(P)-dependent oxidoreductase [Myxococcota bacterium]